MSFREFLKLKYNIHLEKNGLEDLVKNHQKISNNYSVEIKDIYFWEYLKQWNYPFSLDINYDFFQ